MLCPVCHGRHLVEVAGTVRPCPECGGMGEIHCCEGLQVQPGGPEAGCRVAARDATAAAATPCPDRRP
jgi:hypothetical protein